MAFKVEEIVIQVVVRQENEAGEKIGESLSQPAKVFRAATPDVWAFIDAELNKPKE